MILSISVPLLVNQKGALNVSSFHELMDLKLSDIHRLRKIRNQQREELAQNAVFIPILFGPDTTNPQDGGMPMI